MKVQDTLLTVLVISLFVNFIAANVCEVSDSTGSSVSYQVNIGQTFVAPMTGNLRRVTLPKKGSLSDSVLIQLFAGEVLQNSSSSLADSTIYVTGSTYRADFTYAPVTAGSTYTVLITDATSALSIQKGSYSNGSAVVDAALASYDLAFEFCFSGFELQSRLQVNGDNGTFSIEYITLDSEENLIVVGELSDQVNLNGTFVDYGSWTGFVAKFDNTEEHNLLWYVILPTTSDIGVYVVSTGPKDEIAVAGYFVGNVTFANSICVGQGGNDLFIVLYNSDGVEQWHKCYGSSGEDTDLNAIAVGTDSSVYAAGGFTDVINLGGADLGATGNISCYVAKFSSSGEHIWSISYPTGGYTWSVAFDSSHENAVAIAGSTVYALEINGTTIPAPLGKSAFLLKLSSSDGSYVWHQSFSNFSEMESVAFDSNGDVLIAGFLLGATTIASLEAPGPGEAFLMKFSSSGTPLWLVQGDGGSNYPTDVIKVGYQNTVFVIGNIAVPFSLGGDELQATGGYIAAFTSDGEFLWQNQYQSSDYYTWGLYANPNTKTVAWGNTFGGSTSVDGFSYSAAEEGAFIHFYKGIYVEDDKSSSSKGDSGLSKAGLIAIVVVVPVVVLAGLVAAVIFVVRKNRNSNDVEMN